MSFYFCVHWYFCFPIVAVLFGFQCSANAQLYENQPVISGKTVSTATPIARWEAPLHVRDGSHHVTVLVGQPPVAQALIVDTGSRLTAWACHPCPNCGRQPTRIYHPENSSTVQSVPCSHCELDEWSVCNSKTKQCEFSQIYSEGSKWKAYEVNDLVAMHVHEHIEHSLNTAVAFTFGCQTSMEGLFRKQYADGIIGLERSDYTLVTTWKKQGVLPRAAFSICATPTGGVLGMGGAVMERHWEKMSYTPLASDDRWFRLELVGLTLDDEPVVNADDEDLLAAFREGTGTILDSGTTDTFLTQKVSKRFEAVWERVTGRKLHSGMQDMYTYDEMLDLPRLVYHFANNVTLQVAPENYMGVAGMPRWEGIRALTLRIYVDEREGAVLGMNSVLNYDVLYDIDGGRVGFAKADCDSRLPAIPSLSTTG